MASTNNLSGKFSGFMVVFMLLVLVVINCITYTQKQLIGYSAGVLLLLVLVGIMDC